LNNSLYAWCGPPLGVAIQIGALAATGALAWLVRRQRLARLFTTAAFILHAAALGNYFAQLEPVNVRFRRLAPGQVPSDFPRYGFDGNTATHWSSCCSPPSSSCWACALLMRQAARTPSSGRHPSPERGYLVTFKIVYRCRPRRKSDVFTIGASS
jgi:hypothetical protein